MTVNELIKYLEAVDNKDRTVVIDWDDKESESHRYLNSVMVYPDTNEVILSDYIS